MILLDLDLGDENGLDFLPELLRVHRSGPILVLTATPESETHLRAAAGGARGIVMKEQAPETLVKAIPQRPFRRSMDGTISDDGGFQSIVQSGPERQERNPEADKIGQFDAS